MSRNVQIVIDLNNVKVEDDKAYWRTAMATFGEDGLSYSSGTFIKFDGSVNSNVAANFGDFCKDFQQELRKIDPGIFIKGWLYDLEDPADTWCDDRTIKAFDIEYDTDGEEIDLPKELLFKIDAEDLEDFDECDDLSDLICDETGFCIFGCKSEWVQ